MITYISVLNLKLINEEILETFPLRSKTRQKVLLSPHLIHTILEVSANTIRQEKSRIKKEVKLSLLGDNIVGCLESPRESIIKPTYGLPCWHSG